MFGIVVLDDCFLGVCLSICYIIFSTKGDTSHTYVWQPISDIRRQAARVTKSYHAFVLRPYLIAERLQAKDKQAPVSSDETKEW